MKTDVPTSQPALMLCPQTRLAISKETQRAPRIVHVFLESLHKISFDNESSPQERVESFTNILRGSGFSVLPWRKESEKTLWVSSLRKPVLRATFKAEETQIRISCGKRKLICTPQDSQMMPAFQAIHRELSTQIKKVKV